MAADYTSGSAASLSDLRTAIENFLTTVGGWSAVAGTGNNRLLSKGDLFVRLGYNTNQLYIFGGLGISGTALTTESARGSNIGVATANPITFPVTYEIYWNDTPEEVYIVINYNGDKYQHLHWGESDIPDIGGSGLWFNGSYDTNTTLTGTSGTSDASRMYMSATRDAQGRGYVYVSNYSGMGGAYFMAGEINSWLGGGIHCGLEGSAAWRMSRDTSVGAIRQQYQSLAMMMALPSLFNEAEVLLPIYIPMRRTGSVDTIVGVLRHARMLRLDNTTPGDIITYGGDQWKCYPLYAKNTTDRNGINWTTGAQHSGTVGIALRYPGA